MHQQNNICSSKMTRHLSRGVMSDITAVVLTIGEPSTDLAIASVQCQTMHAARVVIVRDVSPFHCAFNTGAVQVRTPFFVQVDADVILDPTCFEDLYRCISPDVGIVTGQLRDPLLGRVRGVKLFRTECFKLASFHDSVSPDADFARDAAAHGWERVYALNSFGKSRASWHTFGHHRPHYDFHYTFTKFLMEGVRCRYRKHETRFRWLFSRLAVCDHEMAIIATIAAAQGLFLPGFNDRLRPGKMTEESKSLEALLALRRNDFDAADFPAVYIPYDLREQFGSAVSLGVRMRELSATSVFLSQLDKLRQRRDSTSWVSLVGMCHGFTSNHEPDIARSYSFLSELLAPVGIL